MVFSGPNGSGGNAFESSQGTVRTVHLSTLPPSEVNRTCISSIQLEYDTGKKSECYGKEIDKACFHVPDGDAIVRVEVRCGWGTDALRFITRNGVESVWFGGTGGSKIKKFVAPTTRGHELVGVKGRSGAHLDKVEPIWGKTPKAIRVVCKLEPLFEVARCTGFHQSETIKYRVGTSTKQYSSSQISKFAAQAEAKVNWGTPGQASAGASVNSEMQSGFQSAFQATSEEHEYTRTMKVDARERGVYLYRGVNVITLNNGQTITMKGVSIIGSPTPLVHPVRKFELA